MSFLGGSDCNKSACNAGDLGSSPGLGRSPGEGKGYPLQDSGLENSVDCKVHGVAKRRTRLSDFHSLTHFWFGKLDERWLSLLRWRKLGKEVAELLVWVLF